VTGGRPGTVVCRGWTIYAHPLFLAQLTALVVEVEAQKSKDATGYLGKNATKRLAALLQLGFEKIPQNPAGSEYEQGGTLGAEYKHWRRAKFFQQYRLFFRFHSRSKTIVLAWVNDDDTLRSFESKDDAYRTFRKLLNSGNPPDSWEELLKASQSGDTTLAKLTPKAAAPAAKVDRRLKTKKPPKPH